MEKSKIQESIERLKDKKRIEVLEKWVHLLIKMNDLQSQINYHDDQIIKIYKSSDKRNVIIIISLIILQWVSLGVIDYLLNL